MSKQDKAIARINDPRIADYVSRMRNGSTQTFYTGKDSRDWERYRSEGGGSKAGVIMHDKACTIHIEPPERHLYAGLIDGEWWWLNGCAECNGRERDWMTYVECDKHNVCRTCKCPRSELTEAPYGGKHGWQCKSCHKEEHEHEKRLALAAMPDDYDKYDFHSLTNVTCPYCNLEFDESHEHYAAENESIECNRCDNTFKVTASPVVYFDCDRL